MTTPTAGAAHAASCRFRSRSAGRVSTPNRATTSTASARGERAAASPTMQIGGVSSRTRSNLSRSGASTREATASDATNSPGLTCSRGRLRDPRQQRQPQDLLDLLLRPDASVERLEGERQADADQQPEAQSKHRVTRRRRLHLAAGARMAEHGVLRLQQLHRVQLLLAVDEIPVLRCRLLLALAEALDLPAQL